MKNNLRFQYYVYVNNLIGLKTNSRDFHWSFGTNAPVATKQEFEKCKIRTILSIVPDRQVPLNPKQGNFHYFYAPHNRGTLFYYRKLFGMLKLGFTVSVHDNTIRAIVGRTYYNLIRLKVMNVHPIWYILFDLATVLLLQEGYLPLYTASFAYDNRGVLLMGAPNIGKTLTALRLSKNKHVRLLGEDIAVTDGERIYPVPLTNTYRQYGSVAYDKVRKTNFSKDSEALSTVFLLERGISGLQKTNDRMEKVLLLNRYGIRWSNSPAVTVLCYYNDSFSMSELLKREENLLRKVTNCTEVYTVSLEDVMSYPIMIINCLQQ